jgi:hypothetical protein
MMSSAASSKKFFDIDGIPALAGMTMVRIRHSREGGNPEKQKGSEEPFFIA